MDQREEQEEVNTTNEHDYLETESERVKRQNKDFRIDERRRESLDIDVEERIVNVLCSSTLTRSFLSLFPFVTCSRLIMK